MNETQKLKYAELWIQKLADGINPLTNQPVNPNDIVCNEHISNCLRYVAEILHKSVRDDEIRNRKFYITEKQKSVLTVRQKPCQLGVITCSLNKVARENNVSKFTGEWVVDWLISIGMMERCGKEKRVTENGMTFGIITESHERNVILYSPKMQQFIFDNIDSILAHHYQTNEDEK